MCSVEVSRSKNRVQFYWHQTLFRWDTTIFTTFCLNRLSQECLKYGVTTIVANMLSWQCLKDAVLNFKSALTVKVQICCHNKVSDMLSQQVQICYHNRFRYVITTGSDMLSQQVQICCHNRFRYVITTGSDMLSQQVQICCHHNILFQFVIMANFKFDMLAIFQIGSRTAGIFIIDVPAMWKIQF